MTTKELARSKTPEPVQRRVASAPRPLGPFEILHQEIDRVFDGFNTWPAVFREPWPAAFERGFSPSMEVTETDDAIEVATELPGMDEKDVEISVADGKLTIRGEKKFEKDEKKKNYRLVERSYGSFERAVMLPPGVNASKIKARMDRGILKVEVPKPASAKAQSVKIAVE